MTTAIVATIIGALITLVGTLIVIYLRAIKADLANMAERTNSQDTRIDNALTKMAACKENCRDNFVNKEDWLREVGHGRNQLDNLNQTLSRIDGKMSIMEKLPEICGTIAKEITSQIKLSGEPK